MQSGTNGTIVLVNSMDEASVAINTPNGNCTIAALVGVAAAFTISPRTNTSAQIRAVAQLASTTFAIATYGWIDRRGRDN
jgi:hypothetical protein